MSLSVLSGWSGKGFLDRKEGERLYAAACEAARLGPCLEIGSYCGCSTAYLGLGCREAGGTLYTVDHHRGSEEQQPGQDYHDPELVDPATGKIDTFPHLRLTLAQLGLLETVIPIVADSVSAARGWSTPLSLIFIDGGHTFAAAFADYSSWVFHLLPGGLLLIHDLYPDSRTGGQAPSCIYDLALNSGLFSACPRVGTLGVLRRAAIGAVTKTARQRWEKWPY